MNAPKLTRRMLAGVAGMAVVLGLAGATSASSEPPAPPPDPAPLVAYGIGPEVDMKEITEPGGEGLPEARWHNCEVVRTRAPIRRFVVERADGTKAERAIAQPSVRVMPDGSTEPLGPPTYESCVPTEEQVREMHRIAGVDPDTMMPIPPSP
jgi:hypothetical protein